MSDEEMSDEEVDEIFNYWDDACAAASWEELDIILDRVDVKNSSTEYLVCLLTCSNWARNHLTRREEFVARVKSHFNKFIPERATRLLLGLE